MREGVRSIGGDEGRPAVGHSQGNLLLFHFATAARSFFFSVSSVT